MVMQEQELVSAKRRDRIRTAVVVAEVNLENAWFDDFYDRANLSPKEAFLWRIF
jgi:hypothetical protein